MVSRPKLCKCLESSIMSEFLLKNHVEIVSVILAVSGCVMKELNDYCKTLDEYVLLCEV